MERRKQAEKERKQMEKELKEQQARIEPSLLFTQVLSLASLDFPSSIGLYFLASSESHL